MIYLYVFDVAKPKEKTLLRSLRQNEINGQMTYWTVDGTNFVEANRWYKFTYFIKHIKFKIYKLLW